MSRRRETTVDWSEVETCVLDMDGTLLDLHFDNRVWNDVLPRRVAAATGLDHDAARAHVSDTLARERGGLLWYCFEHWSEVFGLDLCSVEAEIEHLISVRPGVLRFLAFLRRRGIRTVLATNAHPFSLERKLSVTRIGGYFEHVVSAHEVGFAKEQDDFWPRLESRCTLAPRRALFVDDNPAVLAAAERFGIRYLFGIARPDSRGTRVEHADFVSLEHFDELISPA